MYFKIPIWCETCTFCINGKEADIKVIKNGYAEIHNNWNDGDRITIKFTAKPNIIHINDKDASSQYPLAFSYGALLFSLPIPEKWTSITGNPNTPLLDDWSWFDVVPDMKPHAPEDELYESLSRVREKTVWNVAVNERMTSDSIKITEKEDTGYVWSNPMVTMKLEGYKAPLAYAPYIDRTAELYGEYQDVTHPVTLELVPYGCTNLRITYFPRANMKNMQNK